MFTVWDIENTVKHLLKEVENVEQNKEDYIKRMKKVGGSEYEIYLFDEIVPKLRGIIQTIDNSERFRDIVLRSWEAQNK
ncbi:MAG: hypothetical protein R2685_11100 [Candidatus Nitrosocosmicus sp.]|nr:hypothetical protein [Candidatus Nitrosocosmicus sp.]